VWMWLARARAHLCAQILEMAADNQLDQAFMNLLDQNILGAQAAGQADAATFLVKVRDACIKFTVRV